MLTEARAKHIPCSSLEPVHSVWYAVNWPKSLIWCKVVPLNQYWKVKPGLLFSSWFDWFEWGDFICVCVRCNWVTLTRWMFLGATCIHYCEIHDHHLTFSLMNIPREWRSSLMSTICHRLSKMNTHWTPAVEFLYPSPSQWICWIFIR